MLQHEGSNFDKSSSKLRVFSDSFAATPGVTGSQVLTSDSWRMRLRQVPGARQGLGLPYGMDGQKWINKGSTLQECYNSRSFVCISFCLPYSHIKYTLRFLVTKRGCRTDGKRAKDFPNPSSARPFVCFGGLKHLYSDCEAFMQVARSSPD